MLLTIAVAALVVYPVISSAVAAAEFTSIAESSLHMQASGACLV